MDRYLCGNAFLLLIKMVLVNKDMYICFGDSATNNMYVTAKVIK